MPLRCLVLVLVCLFPAGCKVTDAAIDTAKTAAAGNDRYTQLAGQALDGTVDSTMGLEPVSPADLNNTPASVRLLIVRLLESLHVNRLAWHSVLFQLNEGDDPEGMDLKALTLPRDEADSLLDESD